MVMTVFGDLTKAMSSIVLTTFGEPVVFHIEGQAEALPGRGVFSAAHQEVDASTGLPVSMVQPVLEVRHSDLPATPPMALRCCPWPPRWCCRKAHPHRWGR